MNKSIDRQSLILITALGMFFLFAMTRVSDGFFLIDETIYFIGAEALWKTGSFAVQNGFETYGSDNLRTWLLSEGPSGLTPQYPIGLTLAAFPFMGLFGQKTFIFLNVCAGIGTLFVTYAIAKRLFASQQIAFTAIVFFAVFSFWPEYVLAHWPHSISIFFTSTAIYFFLVASASDQQFGRILLISAASGAAVGLGMFFRLEAFLLLPAFGAIAILYARKPVSVLLGGALGLLPVLFVMMLFNDARCGSLNPLSYGSTGGATQMNRHIVPAVGVLIALVGLIVFRVKGGFSQKTTRLATVAGVLCLIGLALSPYGSLLEKILRGMHALYIDSTVISDSRVGVYQQTDGTLMFWGLPKKALGQSLPWLGCLVLLAGAAYRQHKQSVVTILVLFAIWSLPFVMRSWHGGLGSNMRYFLPMLPLLTILASAMLSTLADKANLESFKLPLCAVILGFAGAAYWSFAMPDRGAQLHQLISLGLLFAVTGVCLIAARIPTSTTARPAFLIVSLAFGLSAFLGLDDLRAGQERRAEMAQLSAETAAIQEPVVIYAGLATAVSVFSNPDHLVALPHPVNNQVDSAFIKAACDDGYSILTERGLVQFFLNEGFELSETSSLQGPLPTHLVQINCTV